MTNAPQDFRFLDANDYAALLPATLQLFNEAFGRAASPQELQWRYLRNPLKDVVVCVQPGPEGSLAASYSVCPVDVCIFGDVVRTGLSMTTMTAPRFAGQGLFVRLAAATYEHMQAHGYGLVWGFPNVNSHYGFTQRLAWQDLAHVPTLTAEVTPKMRQALPAAADGVVADDGFALDYDRLADLGGRWVGTHRSTAYLRWRYAQHPTKRYFVRALFDDGRVAAYCVAKSFADHDLDIIDLRVDDADQATRLLGAVLAAPQAAKAQRVNCWAPLHHFIYPLYEKLGFRPEAPITYFSGRALDVPKDQAEALMHSRSWYLQMGDSDVY